MALDYNRLTAITREKVLPGIIDQIGLESVTLGKFLRKAKKTNGGTSIQVPVKYRHNSQGGYYSGLELLDSAQETTRTRATWQWKQYHKPIVINNIEQAMNGTGGMSDVQIAPLLASEMEDAKSGMKDALSTALFGDGTGEDGKAMDGLLAAVDDGTNVATYAGINRSTYTWWKAQYTALGGSLTLSAMATMYDSVELSGKGPDVIVTTKEIWSDYEALLQDQIRFVSNDGSGNSLDGAATKLAYRATPIEKDEYCPSGKMFFLATDTFEMRYMPHPDYPTDGSGFAMRDLREPDNQDGKVGFIFFYHNLICKEPRRNGQLDTIS